MRLSFTIFSTSGFLKISYPQAPGYPLGPFQIFSKIRGDIRSSRQGEPPVSLTLVANGKNLKSEKFKLFFLTSMGNRFHFKLKVIDTGGAPGLRITRRIFEKNRNDPNIIFRGMGEDDS
jgi:hypothetical protein